MYCFLIYLIFFRLGKFFNIKKLTQQRFEEQFSELLKNVFIKNDVLQKLLINSNIYALFFPDPIQFVEPKTVLESHLRFHLN